MASTKWGLLPIGSVEAHGPHLPLETDTIIAQELALRLMNAWPKELPAPRLLPSFTTTSCSYAAPFEGTVNVPPETAEAALRRRLDDAKMGDLDRVLLVNLHFDPAHVQVLRLVATTEPTAVYVDLTRRTHAQRIGGEFATGSCHAGSFETSLMLAADPASVQPVYRDLEPLWVDLPAAMKAGKRDFIEAGAPMGYCGEPAKADVTEGHRLYDVLASIVLDEVRAFPPRP